MREFLILSCQATKEAMADRGSKHVERSKDGGEDSSAHTDLTHLYTHPKSLICAHRSDSSVHTTCFWGLICTHTYTHTFGVGGWVGGVGMVTYLGLAYIPNCTHTHTHTFGLGWWVGGWVGWGMLTYVGLAYIPNCTHTHTFGLGWVGGWGEDGNIPWTCIHS